MKRNGNSQVSIDFPTAELSAHDNCPRTPVATPPASNQHALAYDAGRGLVVLVSSADGSTAGSAVVYELDVATKAWSRVETSGPTPTARSSAGLAYDRKTGLFVLFGGADSSASGQPRDVWEYGACTWADRTPAMLPSDWPSARWAPAMTFDFASQRVAMTTGLQHFTYQWEDSA